MALTKQDKDEIREMLNDCMAGNHARTEAKFDIIDVKLDNIITQTTKTNGRVGNLENKSHEYDNHLKNTEDLAPKVRVIEDNLLTQKSLKKYNARLFAISTTILGLLIAAVGIWIKSGG